MCSRNIMKRLGQNNTKLSTTLILAANLGCLLTVNIINFKILMDGGILLVEPNLPIIVGETVGTLLITGLTVAWLLKKIKAFSRPHQS